MSARRSSTPRRSKAIRSIRLQSLRELARDMDAGQVDLLVILGGNPVYDAPADLKFAERMSKVKTRVHLGLYHDETSELCHWHFPSALPGDVERHARFDGTVTIVQPLIAPLYDGKSPHELVAALSGRPQHQAMTIVRAYWMGQRGAKAQPAQTPPPKPARAQNEQEAAEVITQLQARPTTAFDRWWQGFAAASAGHRVQAETGFSEDRLVDSGRLRRHPNRPGDQEALKSSSGPTRRSGTAASPTTGGSRNCPSR